jgi:hypothetical protein
MRGRICVVVLFPLEDFVSPSGIIRCSMEEVLPTVLIVVYSSTNQKLSSKCRCETGLDNVLGDEGGDHAIREEEQLIGSSCLGKGERGGLESPLALGLRALVSETWLLLWWADVKLLAAMMLMFKKMM